MENNNVTQFVGRIRAVRGQITLVACESDYRPKLQEVLVAEENPEVRMEVHSYRNRDLLYCLLLSDKRLPQRNMRVISHGNPLTIPVGDCVLGRAIDLYGNPVDGGEPLSYTEVRPIEQLPAYEGTRVEDAERPLLETGLKALDFFTPLPEGGSLALVGGAGVGKTALMTEIIRNLNDGHDGVTLFAGIGERIREGHELWLSLKETGTIEKTGLIVAHINENAAVRVKVASAAATIAEYFRDEAQRNVLMFADNIFRFVQAGNELATLLEEIPSEFGYQSTLESEVAHFEARLRKGKAAAISSIQTVYVPADQLSDPTLAASLPYFDAVVILSREMSQQGRFPAIDLLNSKSAVVSRTTGGDDTHFTALTGAIELLQQYERISRIVAIIGESELTPQDKKAYERGMRLRNYMTQPFSTLQSQSGREGTFVSRKTTIKDVQDILAGRYDEIAPERFMYIGAAADIKTGPTSADTNKSV